MKKPIDNYKGRFINILKTKSGLKQSRKVDQLPVNADFKSANGFFKSDISLLIDASDKNNKIQFDALASRLTEYKSDSQYSGKSIQELFDMWMPRYIQTPSELQAWPKYLMDNHPELYKRLYPDDVNTTATSEYVDVVENTDDNG